MREKNPPMRAKTFESARENAHLSVKIFKKLCVKNRFFPWKKSKNRQKSVSRTLFFSRRKKKTLPLSDRSILVNLSLKKKRLQIALKSYEFWHAQNPRVAISAYP